MTRAKMIWRPILSLALTLGLTAWLSACAGSGFSAGGPPAYDGFVERSHGRP